MATANYYELLGVLPTATCQEIKQAYRKKARKLHPDKLTDPDEIAQAPELMAQMTEAKEILCHPCKRKKYDEELANPQKDSSTRDTSGYEPEDPTAGAGEHEEKSSATYSSEHKKDDYAAGADEQEENGFNTGTDNNNESSSQDAAFGGGLGSFIEKLLGDLERAAKDYFAVPVHIHKFIPGNTFLHLALLSGMTDLAKDMILSCDDDMHAQNLFGYTPLHYASMLGYTDITALLMENGAAISVNHLEETPLHNALQYGRVPVANILLEKEGKEAFDIADQSGNSPLDLARKACEGKMTPDCETLYTQLEIETESQPYSGEAAGEMNAEWFDV